MPSKLDARSCESHFRASLIVFCALSLTSSVYGQSHTLAIELPESGPVEMAASSSSSLAALPDAPSSSAGIAASETAYQGTDGQPVTIVGLPKRLVLDEWHVLTSPARIRKRDLIWLAPLAGATAASFATDTRAMRDVVSKDPSTNDSAGTASDVIRGGFIGLPVVLFGVGQLRHDERSREAGLLGGEAMIDAYAFGALVKLATFRERPNVDAARGAFYQTSAGWDSSFPSGHAIVAWSSAAVLAGEYNKPWQQALTYTLASGVSISRVLAQQHFPSDALIGSAAGWLIGHYVYRAHHRHPR